MWRERETVPGDPVELLTLCSVSASLAASCLISCLFTNELTLHDFRLMVTFHTCWKWHEACLISNIEAPVEVWQLLSFWLRIHRANFVPFLTCKVNVIVQLMNSYLISSIWKSLALILWVLPRKLGNVASAGTSALSKQQVWFKSLFSHLTVSFCHHKQVLVSIPNKKCSPCCQPGSTTTLLFQVRNKVRFLSRNCFKSLWLLFSEKI